MVGWHHWLNGHGFGWTLEIGDGQGGLASCGSWHLKESDTTERLSWTELDKEKTPEKAFRNKWESGYQYICQISPGNGRMRETQNLVCFIFIPGRFCVQKHWRSGSQAQRWNYAVIKLRHIEQTFGLCGRGRGWDDLGEWHWNMYIIM